MAWGVPVCRHANQGLCNGCPAKKIMPTKMIHKKCGGEIKESETLPGYDSEEHGYVPAYQCTKCNVEIVSDWQIEFEKVQSKN